jgi:hypothetical protein
MLDLPVGSIGPNQARYLQRLRRCPAILDLLGEGAGGNDWGDGHGERMVRR